MLNLVYCFFPYHIHPGFRLCGKPTIRSGLNWWYGNLQNVCPRSDAKLKLPCENLLSILGYFMRFIILFWSLFRALINSIMSICANNKHHKLVEKYSDLRFSVLWFHIFCHWPTPQLMACPKTATSNLEQDILNLDSWPKTFFYLRIALLHVNLVSFSVLLDKESSLPVLVSLIPSLPGANIVSWYRKNSDWQRGPTLDFKTTI